MLQMKTSLFLRLRSTPWCKRTVFSLSKHLLVDFESMGGPPNHNALSHRQHLCPESCIYLFYGTQVSAEIILYIQSFDAIDPFSYETRQADTHTTKNIISFMKC